MPSNRRPMPSGVYVIICSLMIYLCLYTYYEMRLIRTVWPRVCPRFVYQSFWYAVTGLLLACCVPRVTGHERHLCTHPLKIAAIAAMVSTTVTIGVMANRSLLSPVPINPSAGIHVALA